MVTEDLAEIAAADLPFEVLQGATVLVTGASGMLPAYLTEALLHLNESRRLGVRVLAMVRNRARAEYRFAHYAGRNDLQIVEHDAALPFAAPGSIAHIVHAASPASPRHFGGDPVGTLLPNVIGTRHLLDLARQHGAGFLFLSSGEVYGVVDPGKMPIGEEDYGYVDPMQVRSCYAESKRMGETLCAAWHAQYAVAARVARPFHTYGPGLSFDDGRVFADFVANLVRGEDIVLKSDGRAVRAYCYIADATRAFFTILLCGAAGQAYNVGNPQALVSVRELADRLVALFPERGLKVVHDGEPRLSGYLESPIPLNAPDTAKLEALGWRPRHSIESGFLRTVQSYS